MPLEDQLVAVGVLKGQGKNIEEIAEATGLEIGDVQSALSGALPAGVLASVASSVGGLTVHKFAITHDMPGLENGIDVYTPKVGEILYDAWFQVSQEWNGTTPKADIGSAAYLALNGGGLFGAHQDAVNLANGPGEDYLGFQGGTGNQGNAPNAGVSLLQNAVLLGQGPPTPFARTAPGVFTTIDPLQVVISQNPTVVPGVATGATQGAATLYLLTAVPA